MITGFWFNPAPFYFEEIKMTLRIKPNYQRVWAELGDNTKPVDSYIQNGWLAVKPPRQYMNWIQNRQDSMLAYLNQTGVSQWDVNTDYHGGAGTATCSYVQGSDGKVYKCLADNGPSVTGATSKDPVNQPANAAFWEVAFADKSAFDSLSATVPTHTTQIGNGSGVTDAPAWRTAIGALGAGAFDSLSATVATHTTQIGNGSGVTDPAAWRTALSAVALTAFTGANQFLSEDGFQKLPGGLVVQWGNPGSYIVPGGSLDVSFPTAFTTECFVVIPIPITASANTNGFTVGYFNKTTNGFTATNNSATSGVVEISWVAIGV